MRSRGLSISDSAIRPKRGINAESAERQALLRLLSGAEVLDGHFACLQLVRADEKGVRRTQFGGSLRGDIAKSGVRKGGAMIM